MRNESQTAPIEWMDHPEFTPERYVLTSKELGIPEIRTFGFHTTTKAIPPLVRHIHRDAIELTYVEHGDINYYVEDKSCKSGRGDLLVVPANMPHDTRKTPMGLHMQYWVQLEDMTDSESFLLLNKKESLKLLHLLRNQRAGIISLDNAFASSSLKTIFMLFCSSNQSTRNLGAIQLAFFLFSVLEGIQYTKDKTMEGNASITNLIAHILKYPDEEYDLEDLAESANMSLSFFKSQFMRQTGYPPREYINIQKTELAKKMLLSSYSITQIAMELNYSSSNYFSTTFKRITGYTPSEFRTLNNVN